MNSYSVLMSVYKDEKPEYFLKSLDSIFSQTLLTNDFVLIVDGVVGEQLNNIIIEYENKYPTIFHVFRLQQNLGLGNALNFGLKKCRNILVARMDSDDISLPTRCEKQFNYFKNHPDISVLGTQIIDFYGFNKFYYHSFPIEDREIRRYLKKRCPFGHPSVMFNKKNVILAGNYDENMKNQQDYNLWIRMCKNKNNIFHNLDEPLLLMRNDDSLFSRRGGLKYFKLGLINQKLLFNLKLITRLNYLLSIFERFFVQVIMSKSIRKVIYKKVLRNSKVNDENVIKEVSHYL